MMQENGEDDACPSGSADFAMETDRAGLWAQADVFGETESGGSAYASPVSTLVGEDLLILTVSFTGMVITSLELKTGSFPST